MMATVSGMIGAAMEGHRIVLRTPYDEEVNEWVKTLPAARWDKVRCRWTCDLTPAAAYRVLSHAPLHVEADESIRRIGERFLMDISAAARATPTMQPSIRRADSWAPQVKAYNFAEQLEAAMVAVGMGGGKSKVVVDLIVNRTARTTLILCPTSVRGVWRREFDRWAGRPVEVLVLDGSQSVTAKAVMAKKFLDTNYQRNKQAVVVLNYEAAWRPGFAAFALGREWDMVVLDESHRIKAHDSKISKFCSELSERAQFRLCLSGTPMPHSPLDCFGQYRFLDRGIFGTSWHWFRNRYAVENPYIQNAIVGYKNQDELSARFALIACRITDEELDQGLPPLQHIDQLFKLGPEASQIYSDLERKLIAEVKGGTVTVANALVKLIRLQQIVGGHVPLDDSEDVSIVGTEKADSLQDLLTDLDAREPVVVFCRFRADLDAVQRVAEQLGRRYGELSGRRRDITEHATMPEDVDLLGVQVQSGGVGIDLTRARYVVCYSLGYLSPGDYDQLVKRVHRPGQKSHTTFYHLLAAGTVDEVAYAARSERRDEIEAVLSALG